MVLVHFIWRGDVLDAGGGNRRSFDCDSRDETARIAAQDDTFRVCVTDTTDIKVPGLQEDDIPQVQENMPAIL